jgi:cardiolipin synthase
MNISRLCFTANYSWWTIIWCPWTNFDSRSFKLNDEANLNIYDREFARQQSAIFDADIEKSHLVTYEEWLRRPMLEKLIEKVVSLLDWQL